MKKNIFNNTHKGILLTGMSIVLFFLFSCRSTESDQKLSQEKALIKVNISSAEFSTPKEISHQTSVLNSTYVGSDIQKSQVSFNKDFDLVTEIKPSLNEKSNIKSNVQASSVSGALAATEISDLSPNIKYKVVVYDSNGVYVTERDYIKGKEGSTQALSLDGGSTYTFIAYSTNSASSIPPVTFTDANNKTLTNSVIGVSTEDVMYYKVEMQVFGEKENYLNIVLKHLLCQVTAIVDASQTGYNITAVGASFSPYINRAAISLSDGSITTGSATSGNINVIFPTPIDADIVTAEPTIIIGNSTTGTLTFSTLKVGPLTASNITAFSDLVFEPGVKYDAKFTLVPKDVFFEYLTRPAARINGKIWLRTNLGSTADDPDTPSSSIAGNFYQFGRKASVAGGTSANTNTNWNGTPTANNAWNSGTEAEPVKTANDPCPAGFRVPTELELEDLISSTVSSQTGPWKSGDRYSSALVLTSKRNKNVKLTFPAQAYFTYVGLANPPFTPGNHSNTGIYMVLWSSNGSGGANYMRSTNANTSASIVNSTKNNDKEYSMPVRCIAG